MDDEELINMFSDPELRVLRDALAQYQTTTTGRDLALTNLLLVRIPLPAS